MSSILFVDDSPEILAVYKRLFQREKQWKCYYVLNAEEALSHLETYSTDILITDLEMPHIDGVKLLEIVKEQYPNLIRFIISGATLNQKHFETIKLAHRFFRKPANLQAVFDAVEHTLFIQNTLLGKKQRELLQNIESIPSYPFILEEIQQELNSATTSFSKIGRIIEKDPGLTCYILKVVNSDYFDFKDQIISLEHAVSLIGIEGIRGIILAQSLIEEMPVSLYKEFDIEHFRGHCYTTAQFAREIAKFERWSDKKVEIAFVTGLLHDVGRLILETSFTKTEESITQFLKDSMGEKDLSKLERANIGVCHEEVGAYILGLWGAHDEIIEAIALHHYPSRVNKHNFPELTAIIHSANQFAFSLFPPVYSDGKKHLDMEFINEVYSESKLKQWKSLCQGLVAKEAEEISSQTTA